LAGRQSCWLPAIWRLGDTMVVNGKDHYPVARTRGGQFAKGHATPWGGRKPGSRGKLSEAFLSDLFSEWKKSGRSALAQVAKESPDTFLRIISSVMPKCPSGEFLNQVNQL
jgi:hypothetical protein